MPRPADPNAPIGGPACRGDPRSRCSTKLSTSARLTGRSGRFAKISQREPAGRRQCSSSTLMQCQPPPGTGSHTSTRHTTSTTTGSAHLSCPVDEVRPTQARISEVAERAAALRADGARPELHGYDLWHGEARFEGVPPWDRIEIYRAALDAVVSADPSVVIRGVARPLLERRSGG